MSGQNPAYRAGGDIYPSRFVTFDTTDDHQVIQATANSQIQGVSQSWTKAAPVSGASALAAADLDPLTVHGHGELCLLELGGSVTRGDRLKADANGKGVTCATSGAVQNCGAIALESGSSGDLRRVQVLLDTLPATAS